GRDGPCFHRFDAQLSGAGGPRGGRRGTAAAALAEQMTQGQVHEVLLAAGAAGLEVRARPSGPSEGSGTRSETSAPLGSWRPLAAEPPPAARFSNPLADAYLPVGCGRAVRRKGGEPGHGFGQIPLHHRGVDVVECLALVEVAVELDVLALE